MFVSTFVDPPTTDPVITITSTPSSSEGRLYQGDRVTLTCTVTGGKPLSATTVTFTCPGKQVSQDTEGSTGVSSSVTFDSLTNGDHNRVCTCSSKWKQTDWYNRNNSTRLFVNSEFRCLLQNTKCFIHPIKENVSVPSRLKGT